MKFQKLIEGGVLMKKDENYLCVCGSLLKEKAVYAHMKTKKHVDTMKRLLPPVEEEVKTNDCGICTMPKSDFYNCNTCKNSHCMDCHLNMNKCPYCRTSYAPEPAPLNELEWYWAEQDQSHLLLNNPTVVDSSDDIYNRLLSAVEEIERLLNVRRSN